ncbi:39712_t:CDS:1 [Gigaspora margarita]|uniref:39712_t:CDS:1 n=1 Tax=Gigaspora margarita TaxID=4874 RepID=A0ABM8VXV7_GIGMA|nr:39712_t:CDS:1 [Gigaspora margarita]
MSSLPKRVYIEESQVTNSEKTIVVVPSMSDVLFKQHVKKLYKEIENIEGEECEQRIIKDLLEGQDADIIIVKYLTKFGYLTNSIEGIEKIAKAIKNVKDNNKFNIL